ncbi:MAG: tRNA (adenosine(37)-N6)-dimethylallyltransferase MiaA [Xanthomonadales bacterium]|jgi:tRNA dimethylallyltransferase|nr:tRNA (adenosine(37)-N6)-dimethylallyltransferase MiaA [Xanthomonadales bacterium]
MKPTLHKLIHLLGPTASGKSALAETLQAEFNLELVSIDSAQVYRGFDIGSAKPDPITRQRCHYHLIDRVDPGQPFSTADFVAAVDRACADIRARGRVPLIVGGTMLVHQALTRGLSTLPAADPALRVRLAAELDALGSTALHTRLASIDPAAAARIHPNDPQRILRALEVHALTGQPLSLLQQAWQAPAPDRGQRLTLALMPADRAALHQRIAERFDAMLAAGFLDEVRGLMQRADYDPALPAFRAVGYRQAIAHLRGETDVARFRQQAIEATRQLAKRQLTWLRKLPECRVLEGSTAEILEAARAALRDFLDGPDPATGIAPR